MKILLIPMVAATVVAQTPAPRTRPEVSVEINKLQQEIEKTRAFVDETVSRIQLNGQTMTFVSAMNVGPTITGAPYSAEAVSEKIQVLADGNRIVDRSTTKVYRDGQGRERRESGDLVTISDPVARTSYTLNTKQKTAAKAATNGNNVLYVNTTGGRKATVRIATAGQGLTTTTAPRSGDGPVQALGSKVIEGVPATGTRSVTTIPAGQIGNERPIEIVDEEWYSGELQLVVMTRHADPRSGETTYKLTNIQRSEPARGLFEPPSDYKVETARGIAIPAPPAPPKPPAPPAKPE